MNHTYTPQQIALFDRVSSPDCPSLAVVARAGSGKTFSLQQCARRIKGSGIATSFSTSTVKELGEKMPSSFPAATMHSIGFRALRGANPSTKLDSSKTYSLTRDFFNLNEDLDKRDFSSVMKLVSLAKTFGIAPDRSTALLPDEPSSWEDLADQFDLTYSPAIQWAARDILLQSNKLALQPKTPIIDFDDMLYIALLWPHHFPYYGNIISDESQDLNSLQHLMLRRLLRPGGRIIAAGDDRQAIYAFRGALSDSFPALERRFDMVPMPLTVSFRCPVVGVHEAQRYVPDIEAAPGALEGQIFTHNDLALTDVPPVVLCRNNAPLVTLALRLLVSGRTAEVAGKDIGKGLITLTKRITKRNLKSPVFLDRLHKWAEREIKRKPRSRPRVNDKVAALTALATEYQDLNAIRHHLGKLYPDPKSKNYRPAQVQLSTIHRAKGKEWPEILFLDPQLLPSKWAEQEWERTQEDNLAYVGVTRFQETMHYADSKGIY